MSSIWKSVFGSSESSSSTPSAPSPSAPRDSQDASRPNEEKSRPSGPPPQRPPQSQPRQRPPPGAPSQNPLSLFGGATPKQRDGKIDTTRLTGFDPTFLERGAKALREIDSSQNADEVLHLMAEQERARQNEAKKQYIERQLELAQQRQQLEEQQSRNRMHEQQQRSQMEQTREQQRHEREIRMKERESQIQQQTNEEWLKRQNEMFKQQQEMQRRAQEEKFEKDKALIERKGAMDMKVAEVTEKARAAGQRQTERENADIRREQMQQRATLDRTEKIDVQRERYKFIQSYTDNVVATVTDPKKLTMLVAGFGGMSFAYFGAKVGLGVAGRILESRFGKPSLVRETSRVSYRHPWRILSREFNRWRNPPSSKRIMNGLILHPELSDKLGYLTKATQNTAKHNAPYRNILLHGTPGTGKTMFAKKLASHSGLDYAIMTGGDFAQLGRDAVTELHKVFDWSENSSRGTLLFIDEADAFLRKGRGDLGAMGEDMRNALSAYLYRTGQASTKFMLVLATNLPNTLDSAVVDRIDERVHFPLPGVEERRAMFKYYIQQHIVNVTSHEKTGVSALADTESPEMHALYERLAKKAEGLSGRGISKLVIAIRTALYSGRYQNLTIEAAEALVDETIKSNAKF